MSQHYSLKDFLRRAPNTLLDSYFKHKKIQIGLEITELKETKIDSLADILDSLEQNVRQNIETDFQDIHTLANETGYLALRQELGQNVLVLDEKDFMESSFICFFDYPDAFKTASIFQPYFSQGRYWRRVNDIQAFMPDNIAERSQRLTEGLCKHFKKSEGRGRNCKVEYYVRDDKHFFFAFPEDFAFHLIQWVNNEMQKTNVSPAFDIVFVYDTNDGTLDSHYDGSYQNSRILDSIFAETILDCKIPPELYNKPAYALDKFKQRNFTFVTQTQDMIEKILIRKLRFDIRYQRKSKFTVQSDVTGDKGQAALYDDIERLFNVTGQTNNARLPYNMLSVSHAEISVHFKSDGKKKRSPKRFNISTSNSCSLKHDGDDLIIRRILKDSGIELPPANEQQTERQAA